MGWNHGDGSSVDIARDPPTFVGPPLGSSLFGNILELAWRERLLYNRNR